MSLCRSSVGRTGPLPAMCPSWRTWMTSVQSWQRSCAGCQATPCRATAGRDAQVLGVATGNKNLLQGPEGWALCCPGPANWGQEPGTEETWTPRSGTPGPAGGILIASLDSHMAAVQVLDLVD